MNVHNAVGWGRFSKKPLSPAGPSGHGLQPNSGLPANYVWCCRCVLPVALRCLWPVSLFVVVLVLPCCQVRPQAGGRFHGQFGPLLCIRLGRRCPAEVAIGWTVCLKSSYSSPERVKRKTARQRKCPGL